MSLRDKLINFIRSLIDVDVRYITYLADELVIYNDQRQLSYDEIYTVVRDGFIFPIFDDITDIVHNIIAICIEHNSEAEPWVWTEGKSYTYSPDNTVLASSSRVPGQYTLEEVESKRILYQDKVNGTIMCLSFCTMCYLLLIGYKKNLDLQEYIVVDLESKDILYRCNTPVVWNGKCLVDNNGNVHYTGTAEVELRE